MTSNKNENKLTDLNRQIDFFKIGLKCGLEIHQQLNTKKLFCDCKFIDHVNNEELKPDFEISRKLRQSKSETGKIDAAAKFEIRKAKTNKYLGFHNSSCLVELDEEPPHEVNKDALNITLEVAKFFNMEITDKISFMRKIVLDGSNTSGFQRTALIATDGSLEEKNVRIETVCLEEDACKKIKDSIEGENIVSTYDLSRLGTPLIEIATAPDIKTPIHAKEVAEFIGMVLRSTGKVKRGLGTIRQDVNVSIKGGVRVEIKGAQQLNLIPDLVINEVLRQKNLNKIYFELKKKKIMISENFDLTNTLKNTKSKILRKFLDNKGIILGIKLSNMSGFLGIEIQPNKRFGSEVAGRVKVLGIKGLFHSDELPKYGITEEEVSNIKKELNCAKEDAFILIAEKEEKARKGINEVKIFLEKFELAKEVRQANPDATTTYLRPMPGSSRMYPETDLPEIEITEKKIKELPNIKLLSKQYEELKEKFGIDSAYSKKLIKLEINIEKLIKTFNKVEPKFIAEFLLDYPKEIKKRYNLEINILDEYQEVLNKVNSSDITKKDAFEILLLKAQNKKVDYSKFKKLSVKEVKEKIKKVIKENKGAPPNAIMGMCMKELKGQAEGNLVKKILDELLN